MPMPRPASFTCAVRWAPRCTSCRPNTPTTKKSILALGVTPQTTYLYIQGHHLFDNVVVPILNKVCNRLRQERQDEIARTARHHTQRTNEMSCYEHSIQDIRQTLKKNTGYMASEPFQRILHDLASLFK